MLYSGRIRRTLNFLDREYNRHIASHDPERPVIYSELGILELSGWIEEGFDEIARNCVRRRKKTHRSRDILEAKIKNTQGFTYNNHVRELLAVALGTIELLEVEKKLDRDGSLSLLKSELGSLNQQRRAAAHTFTKGTTPRFDAPSITLARFLRLESVLRELWAVAGR